MVISRCRVAGTAVPYMFACFQGLLPSRLNSLMHVFSLSVINLSYNLVSSADFDVLPTYGCPQCGVVVDFIVRRATDGSYAEQSQWDKLDTDRHC